MLFINKISAHSAIDHAAEELRKYLYMMMPEGDGITTRYSDEVCGFRLGLMSDLGLDTSDVEDVELDDILYIDCDKNGGIIAAFAGVLYLAMEDDDCDDDWDDHHHHRHHRHHRKHRQHH